jgi:hypothetical protein
MTIVSDNNSVSASLELSIMLLETYIMPLENILASRTIHKTIIVQATG